MAGGMMYSAKKVSYSGYGQSVEMLAYMFQELFFDVADQGDSGLLVLDRRLDFIAGNEKGREICGQLFPFDAGDMSCVRAARLIRQNFRLGCFQFHAGPCEEGSTFDFSVFPKTLKQADTVSCYICTVEENGTDRMAKMPRSAYYKLLTRRQIEVVELMATGMENREIAEELNLSEHTVHKHLENIRERLGVRNRVGILNKLNLMG